MTTLCKPGCLVCQYVHGRDDLEAVACVSCGRLLGRHVVGAPHMSYDFGVFGDVEKQVCSGFYPPPLRLKPRRALWNF